MLKRRCFVITSSPIQQIRRSLLPQNRRLSLLPQTQTTISSSLSPPISLFLACLSLRFSLSRRLSLVASLSASVSRTRANPGQPLQSIWVWFRFRTRGKLCSGFLKNYLLVFEIHRFILDCFLQCLSHWYIYRVRMFHSV